MYARIWYEPNGVKVTTFAPGASESEKSSACRTLLADGRVEATATFEDVESVEALITALPGDRSERHKWRKNPLGKGCVVDALVPDPPHPKQALLESINSATTIAQLKVAMREMIQ